MPRTYREVYERLQALDASTLRAALKGLVNKRRIASMLARRDKIVKHVERERKIIVKRFLDEDKKTLAEIGEDFGVSKERIRQIEAKALGKLHIVLSDHGRDASDLLALTPPV